MTIDRNVYKCHSFPESDYIFVEVEDKKDKDKGFK